MKQLLTILLAAALLTTLCACGGDTTYQALTDALASGDYEAVKAEMSSLSPDYKAEQEELSVYQEEYGTLIDALEAEDYEAAQEALTSRIPTEPEPEYTYVDITLDNWQEYFTLSETIPVFEGNELVSLKIELSLNEQYRDKVARNSEDNTMSLLGEKIAVEVSYDLYMYKMDIDTENKTATKKSKGAIQFSNPHPLETFALGDHSFSGEDGTTFTVARGRHITASDQNGNTEDAGYSYPENCKITRIQGKLPLLAE